MRLAAARVGEVYRARDPRLRNDEPRTSARLGVLLDWRRALDARTTK